MSAYPYSSSTSISTALTALGTTGIASDDTLLLKQAVVLAANLMS